MKFEKQMRVIRPSVPALLTLYTVYTTTQKKNLSYLNSDFFDIDRSKIVYDIC